MKPVQCDETEIIPYDKNRYYALPDPWVYPSVLSNDVYMKYHSDSFFRRYCL